MSRPKGSKNKPKEPIQETIQEPEAPNVDRKEDEVISPAPTPAYRARTALIEDIVSHNKDLQTEQDNEEHPEDLKEEEQEPPKVEEPPKEEEKLVVKHKFIVDGQEIELSEDEIRERIQKSSAADKRLAEATRLLEDAKKTTLHKEPPQPPAKTSSEADVDKQLVESISKAVLYGDEEQVTQAFAKILGKGRTVDPTQTQGMTPQQVQSYVMETLAYEKGLRLLETSPEQGGYADIYTDPVLKARFQQREAELRDVHQDKRSYADLYKSIGDEIRQWRENLVKQYIPPTGLEDRDKLKANTGVIRGAGGKPSVPQVSAPKSALERHEEVIEQTRRARGLN